jgi:hypothetical protein
MHRTIDKGANFQVLHHRSVERVFTTAEVERFRADLTGISANQLELLTIDWYVQLVCGDENASYFRRIERLLPSEKRVQFREELISATHDLDDHQSAGVLVKQIGTREDLVCWWQDDAASRLERSSSTVNDEHSLPVSFNGNSLVCLS